MLLTIYLYFHRTFALLLKKQNLNWFAMYSIGCAYLLMPVPDTMVSHSSNYSSAFIQNVIFKWFLEIN